MEQYISKAAVVAEIERRKKELIELSNGFENQWACGSLDNILSFLNTLEVKDPYEQCVQYDSIKAGIQAHAETYSFNIESELFYQLTKEQQKLWRKEIEQACISGGEVGVELTRDTRYKETLEAKDVDLDKEINRVWNETSDSFTPNCWIEFENIAKYFFELGLKAQKGE